MRICFVTQEYPPDTAKGGIAAQAIVKATKLKQRGHDVHVISRAVGWTGMRIEQGVPVRRLPGPRLSAHTEIADWLAWSCDAAAGVADLHYKKPLDLVVFPEWACEAYVHLLNRTEHYHPRTIVNLHGPIVLFANKLGWPDLDSTFYRIAKEMEGVCFRDADAIYSSSRCSADWCEREHGRRATPVPVAHAGIDASLFRPRGDAPADPTVIYSGRVAGSKGTMTLLDAAIRVAKGRPNLRLVLVGRGEPQFVANLKRRAAEAGFNGLELAGFVPRERLADYLSAAHVYAAPSYYEPGPVIANLEAMACGLPVVACSDAGAAEVIDDGETGLLVPPKDVDALAAAIERLLDDPDEAKRIGENAAGYVAREATAERCIDRIEQMYQGFIDTIPESGYTT